MRGIVQGDNILPQPHYKAKERHKQNYDTDNAVNKPHTPHIEVRPHCIHEKCHHKPPQYRTGENRRKAYYVVVVFIIGRQEIKPRKQSYYQEQYQRIGECKQKPGHKILRVIHLALLRRLQCSCRILLYEVKSEYQQHDAAKHLQQALIGLYEIYDKRQPKSREQTIEHIGESSSYTGVESCPTSLVERALYAQHAHRTHRRRNQYSYYQPSE